MASLLKQPGSPFWYARFHFRGKEYWRSTKKKKKSDAEKELRRIQAEVQGDVSLSVMFDQVLQKITEIEDVTERDTERRALARKLLQGMTSKLAVSDVWDTWAVNPKKRNPKESTLVGYKAIWKRFALWLESKHKGVKNLHEVTPTMTEDYAADLWKSGISPATYNAHVKFLRSAFKTLSIKAGIELNPWLDIPTMDNEAESKRNLSTEELAAVCKAAKGDLRVWLAVGLYTGLRLGDVVNLKWENIDLKTGMIEVMPMKTARKRKVVRFPLHPALQAVLQDHKDKQGASKGYLFREAVKVYNRDRGAITKQIQAHFKSCGIQTTEKPTNGHRKNSIVRVGFHSLRHSFVSLCAANRVPEVAIMEMVGHGSPAMTKLYSHAGDEQKALAIGKLADFTKN